MEISAYVKKQCDKGYIEVELKGAKGKQNLVIRRNLIAKAKTSTFSLNGQSSTGKEISEKIAELNIQVGNLWYARLSTCFASLRSDGRSVYALFSSFLPQDKVSSFAAMNPQQLLRETQRAAGDQRLTTWHDTLIASGRDMKGLTEVRKTSLLANIIQWLIRSHT